MIPARLSIVTILVTLGALASSACSVAAAPSSDEPAEASSAALAIGGGGGGGHSVGYTCDDAFCTCTGDDDCNDMFSDGVCGPRAICQINSADIPRCRCTMAGMTAPPPPFLDVHTVGGLRALAN